MNLGHHLGVAIRDAVRPEPEPKWSLIGQQIGEWSYEFVRVAIENLDPIRFEAWNTQADERTCPTCGQLDGRVWQEGDGFTPPVHDNCRCQRVYHHTEFNKRITYEWQKRSVWTTRTDYRWQRTD